MIEWRGNLALLTTKASRLMDRGSYVAFMIGPDSDHDLVDVELGGRIVRVGAGRLVLIPPWTGAPSVKAVRKGGVLAAHVVGLTCLPELAVGATRRHPALLERTTGTAAAAETIFTLAAAGRRHAEFILRNTHATVGLAWATRMRRYIDASTYDEWQLDSGTLAANANPITATTARHEGGTDNEEIGDLFVLAVARSGGVDGSYAVSGESVGELGA